MNKKTDIVAQLWVILKFNFLTGHCYFLKSFLVHGWVAFHTMPLWETLALWVHWISFRMVWNVPWNLYFHDHDAIFRGMLQGLLSLPLIPVLVCLLIGRVVCLLLSTLGGVGQKRHLIKVYVCSLGCAQVCHLLEVGLFSFSFLAGRGSEWIWWCQPSLKL
jgi:hypothetical protein